MNKKKIFLLLVVVMVLVFVVRKTDFVDNREAFKINAIDLANFVYLHEHGYSDFCSKYNYKLEKYPQKFTARIKDDIERVNNLIKRANIEDADWGSDRDEIIQKIAKRNFDDIKKGYVLAYLANERKVKVEDIIWEDSFYDIVPYKNICIVFDEDADYVLDETEYVIQNFKYQLDYLENEFEIVSINFSI